MANDEVAFQNQTGCGARLSRFGRSICNKEKGEFLNRTPGSWAKIAVFYTIFYSCLAGFFAAMLAGFFYTIDPKFPTQRNMYSLLKSNPGMGFKPKPDLESSLIRFTTSDNKTYEKYVNDTNAYLQKYMEKQNGTVVDCAQGGNKAGDEEVCKVLDLNMYGPCTAENNYGFEEGQPCILLKINKIIDWEPEAFGGNGTDDPNETEEQAKRRKQAMELIPGGVLPTDQVAITCQGENPPDEDLLGEVTMYPKGGFPFKWFPYRNQVGYRSPLVFAQFNNFTKGVVMQVWCKMWAKNIKHHKNDKAGSVHFELLMDQYNNE